MSRIRVPIYNTPAKAAFIETDATKGATLGVDLYYNGQILKPEDILNAKSSTQVVVQSQSSTTTSAPSSSGQTKLQPRQAGTVVGPAGPSNLNFVFPTTGTPSVANDGLTTTVTIPTVSGPTGPTGPTGPAGTNGTNGATGATGPQGATGATGPQGATGAGTQGPQGTQGSTGPQGVAGSGTQGPQGVQGPQGPQGGGGGGGSTPTGTGYYHVTAGVMDTAAKTPAQTAIDVSSFQATGLTIPVSTSFTAVNTFAAVDKSDRLQLTLPATPAGNMLLALTQANPYSAPYTIDLAFSMTAFLSSNSQTFGIILNGGGAAYRNFAFRFATSVSGELDVDIWTNSTMFFGRIALASPGLAWMKFLNLRITDDGTTRKYWVSADGKSFNQVGSEPSGTGVSGSVVGFGGFNANNNAVPATNLIVCPQHFKVTNSILGDAA